MDKPGDDAPSSALHLPGDGRISLDGALLKHLRAKCGWSQAGLAERCVEQHRPVSIASIKRAETGHRVLYRTARHLAGVYGVPLEHLWRKDTEASALPHGSAPDDGGGVSNVFPLHPRTRP